MQCRRIFFVVIDGGADRPQASLSGVTPFEKALTPTFDRLAVNGIQGLITFFPFDSVNPYLPGPTSDQAHLMLIGETDCYSNRGEFMAWGIGLSPEPKDLCFRAYIKARIGSTIIRFSPTLSREEANTIEQQLNHCFKSRLTKKPVQVVFRFEPYTNLPRWGAILMRADIDLGQEITTPDHLPKLEYFSHDSKVFESISNRKYFADALPSNLDKVLRQIHAVNPTDIKSENSAILVREFVSKTYHQFIEKPLVVSAFSFCVGMVQPTEPAISIGTQKKFGCRWKLIRNTVAFCEKIEVHGVMRSLQFDHAVYTNNILADEQKIIQVANDNDFIFLQFKETDDLSHDNDPEGKVDVIEKIDSFIGNLHRRFHKSVFVITADHTTPCGLYQRIHTREPVPVLVCGPGIDPDNTTKFSERHSKQGKLGTVNALEFLGILRDQTSSI